MPEPKVRYEPPRSPPHRHDGRMDGSASASAGHASLRPTGSRVEDELWRTASSTAAHRQLGERLPWRGSTPPRGVLMACSKNCPPNLAAWRATRRKERVGLSNRDFSAPSAEVNPAGKTEKQMEAENKSKQGLLIEMEKEAAKVRGRKVKVKAPTRLDRSERLRERIVHLTENLIASGFGDLLTPPGPVKLLADPINDPKTDGIIGHVEEPLATYIQR